MKKITSSLLRMSLAGCSLLGISQMIFANTETTEATEEYVAPVIQDNLARLKIERQTKSRPLYRVVKVREHDPNASVPPKKEPSFRLIGGKRMEKRVIDKNRKTVFKGDNTKSELETVTGVASSPDGRRASVKLAEDKGAYVIDPDGTSFKLPVRPPGEHKFPFDLWEWIDNDTLVATAADMKLDADGKPVKDDDNAERNRIYVYKISRNELTELELPVPLKSLKMVIIREVNEAGHVHLLHDDADTTLPMDLGWFEIIDLRAKKK